jgi:UDP-glucose 4-epimerase
MERDKRRVLLVGSGFIGTALLNKLVQSEYPVRVISRHIPSLDSELIESHQLEISEALRHPEIWQEVDAVIYTLHQDRPSERQYDPAKDVDYDLMVKVLEQLNHSTCRTFIYLSSGGAVYGMPQTTEVDELHARKPISAYGESKKRIEDLLIENSNHAPFNTLILRPSNVYGNQTPDRITGIINHLITAVKQQRDFTIWGDGYGQKGYLHVDDLNELIMLMIRNFESKIEVFNVCSEEYYTPRQLLQLIPDLGHSINSNFADQKKFDVFQIRLSSKKARKTFDWKPRHLLKDYIAAHLNNK